MKAVRLRVSVRRREGDERGRKFWDSRLETQSRFLLGHHPTRNKVALPRDW